MKNALLWMVPLVSITLTAADLPAAEGPQFRPDGQLMRPDNYREWVYLSSGLGMTYGPVGSENADRPPMFDNVFVTRTAYKSFLQTGTWPDKTMFVLDVCESESKASNKK